MNKNVVNTWPTKTKAAHSRVPTLTRFIQQLLQNSNDQTTLKFTGCLDGTGSEFAADSSVHSASEESGWISVSRGGVFFSHCFVLKCDA